MKNRVKNPCNRKAKHVMLWNFICKQRKKKGEELNPNGKERRKMIEKRKRIKLN